MSQPTIEGLKADVVNSSLPRGVMAATGTPANFDDAFARIDGFFQELAPVISTFDEAQYAALRQALITLAHEIQRNVPS